MEESKQSRIHEFLTRIAFFASHHPSVIIVSLAAAIIIIFQFVLFNATFIPGTHINDLDLSGLSKTSATSHLNDSLASHRIQIFTNDNEHPNLEFTSLDLGLNINVQSAIDRLNYPWYIRLIPSSFLWYAHLHSSDIPLFNIDESILNRQISFIFGDPCRIEPIDASIIIADDQLAAIPSVSGGKCNINDLRSQLSGLRPSFLSGNHLRLNVEELVPTITTAQAQALASTINFKLQSPIELIINDENIIEIPRQTLLDWLIFESVDQELVLNIDLDQATAFLEETVVSKVYSEGPPIIELDILTTIDEIRNYLLGLSSKINAQITTLDPLASYARTYRQPDLNLSRIMQDYANSHPGTFGVQLIELSGARRLASYNESQQFIAASTYKLFVAFGTLSKIEAGLWRWNDLATGSQNISTCFERMIALSDNPCAEALLKKYGATNLTKSLQALGLANSGWGSWDPKTTAADLAFFLYLLETRQLPLQPASHDRLINTMSNNIYRRGIPSGSSGQVANKVGFLDGLLHDAGVIYLPTNTYILVVLTRGSSGWPSIASLTTQLETFLFRP